MDGMMTHLDLFSGIGGFALAAKWNGIETVQFVEIDKRCSDFLSKAWPGVAIHDDVRTFHYSGRPVFLLTGGVPCQPASRAGKQRGAEDDRWLWPEAIRVLGEVLPAWAIFENPPGIGDVGLAGILSQVENLGYEVRVFGIPACAVGSPHIRMRYWIVGHGCESASQRGTGGISTAETERRGEREQDGDLPVGPEYGAESILADATTTGRETNGIQAAERCSYDLPDTEGDMGDTERASGESRGSKERREAWTCNGNDRPGPWSDSVWLPCADGKVRRAPDDSFGLVDGLHRSVLGALGNSIVPQVAAEIIRAIVVTEKALEGREG